MILWLANLMCHLTDDDFVLNFFKVLLSFHCRLFFVIVVVLLAMRRLTR